VTTAPRWGVPLLILLLSAARLKAKTSLGSGVDELLAYAREHNRVRRRRLRPGPAERVGPPQSGDRCYA